MDFLTANSGGMVAHGDVASMLLNYNMDLGALRPFWHPAANGMGGVPLITLNNAKGGTDTLVTNAPAALRYDTWKAMDAAVLEVARQRLTAVAAIQQAGLSYSIPNGMSRSVFQYEMVSDSGEATISMDGLRDSYDDRPMFDIRTLPLPIIHSDFSLPLRYLQESRNSNMPLDTTKAANATRRVAEQIEKLALGVLPTYTYGGGTIYGMTNFPQRLTKSMTTPTTSNQATVVAEVLQMRQQLIAANQTDDVIVFYSPNWDQFLDTDYSASKGDITLRERLMKINKISSMIPCDYLGTDNYEMIMVTRNSNSFRMINAMDFTTVQWESKGGLEINFKVMAIVIPQPRADYNGSCGIVHGSAAL